MKYQAKGRVFPHHEFDGEIQVFNFFGSYGAITGDGYHSLVSFSHRTSQEVVDILRGQGFELTLIGEERDEDGNLKVCIAGREVVLNSEDAPI